MRRFQEDDDLDLERELADTERNMDGMAADMRMMGEHRNHLRKQIQKKQLDPLTAKALELAQNLGHALGANEALGRKVDNLNKRIEVRDSELDRLDDRDAWKTRAEAAEATLERSKKRRRSR